VNHPFLIKNKYRVFGAVGFSGLYLLFVGAWWVLSGGRGERFGFMVSVLNFPAVVVFLVTPLERWMGNPAWVFNIIIFIIGPLQYGLLGWLLGPFLERFDLEGEKHRSREQSKQKNEDNLR
jgi:hypothetical protein